MRYRLFMTNSHYFNNSAKKLKKDQSIYNNSNGLTTWLLLYASSYAFFHIIPAFLIFDIKNGLMVADLFDLITPFIMALLIYRIYRILLPLIAKGISSFFRWIINILLIFGIITFVEGHGMHLSANAIARYLTPAKDFPIFNLTYYFDEILSHIFWGGGLILLSVGIVLMGFAMSKESLSEHRYGSILTGSLLYGFSYFVNAVEGQTVVFTFPMAVTIPTLIGIIIQRQGKSVQKNPVLSFFMFSYIIATCFFLIWTIWQKGFPQFGEIGWI